MGTGLALGLGFMLHVLRQRGKGESVDALATENRMMREEIERAKNTENGHEKIYGFWKLIERKRPHSMMN